MSLIGEFHVSADDFVLAQTMSQKPDLRFEFERFIPIAGSMMPYLWVAATACARLRQPLQPIQPSRISDWSMASTAVGCFTSSGARPTRW